MSRRQIPRQKPSRVLRRAGFSYRGLSVALALLTAVPAIGWSVLPKGSWFGQEDVGPMMYTAERGEFIHDITERGNIESASNVEIRCRVESRGSSSSAASTILWIVPEGTYIPAEECLPEEFEVTLEDLETLQGLEEETLTFSDIPEERRERIKELLTKTVLIRLDSSSMENDRTQQQILCENSRADVIQAENVYDTALIARREYLEGTYLQDRLELDIQLSEAEVARNQAIQYLRFSEKLERKGYVTKLQLEDDRTQLEKAENAVNLAEKSRYVLEEFTRERSVKSLDANIDTSEAKLAAEKASNQLDKERLTLIEKQIVNCTIFCPEPGQVVYANVQSGRGGQEIVIEEGVSVRERQVIIRLPDPKRMQVKAKINEARISLVHAGMAAKIRLDAFPDVELTGFVEKVNEYPVPTSFFSASIKEYETTVTISGSAVDLRPGLTAEVKIRVQQEPSVLQVPVQSIIEHGMRHYCVVPDQDGWKAQQVTIGATNDKFVVIEEKKAGEEIGLEDGTEVVLNAALFRDRIDLPKLSAAEAERPQAAPRNPAVPAAAGPKPGGAGGDPNAMFQQFDADGNGQLGTGEVPDPLRARLGEADSDGDGSLSRDEFSVALSKMQAAGGGPGGGKGPRPGGGGPGGGGARRPGGGGGAGGGGGRGQGGRP